MNLNSTMIICDGCGLPASPEHIAARVERLELATRCLAWKTISTRHQNRGTSLIGSCRPWIFYPRRESRAGKRTAARLTSQGFSNSNEEGTTSHICPSAPCRRKQTRMLRTNAFRDLRRHSLKEFDLITN